MNSSRTPQTLDWTTTYEGTERSSHRLMFNVTISMLPLQCYHFSVTISVLPFQCYHFSVTISMLPFQCYHFNVTISVLPFQCYHFNVSILMSFMLPLMSQLIHSSSKKILSPIIISIFILIDSNAFY